MKNFHFFFPEDVSPRSSFIVGVSGGCDSVALLHLLAEKCHNPSRQLIAVHVNYGLRGKQSQADEKYVRKICAQWKIPLRVLKLKNFKKKIKGSKKSLQELAREIRYSFFQRLTHREKAWGAVVAHHLEDQAETILDRLLRGTGTKGFSGLHEIQTLNFSSSAPALKVWRPLLRVPKESLRDYLKSRKINWREDKSNQKLDYRRNQIRHEVLPFLRRWNPRVVEVLARMGEVTSAENQLLDEVLIQTVKSLKDRWNSKTYFCNVCSFEKMHQALRRLWARRVAERLTENARGLSFDQVEQILRVWDGQEKGPRDIGYGLSAGKDQSWVYLKNLGLKKR